MSTIKASVLKSVEDLQFAIAFERRMRDGKTTSMLIKWEKELDHLTMLAWAVGEDDKFTAQAYYEELNDYSKTTLDEAGLPAWLETT